MRFEIRYPTGATHEVELQGTVAILGRDPSCDLVINDVKCSRRHAVMEAGPDGLVVRDSGSANGVFVNGRKVERVALKEGDEVKLGDVTLIVLPEEVAGTLVMAPDEYGGVSTAPPTAEMPSLPGMKAADPDGTILPLPGAVPPPAPPLPHPPSGTSGTIPVMPIPSVPPRPAAPPPPPPPPPPRAPSLAAPPPPFAAAPPPPMASAPPPAAASAGGTTSPPLAAASASARPLTVTVLAALWGLNIPLSLLSAAAALFASEGIVRFVLAAFYLVLTGISGVMGWGLWTLKPWARMAQIVLAGIGIVVTCPFVIACVTVIVYLVRPAARARFAGLPESDPKETMFAILLGVGVVVGGIGLIGMAALAFFGAAAQAIPVR